MGRCQGVTPERWRRIEEVFGDAVELAVVERAAFLDRACDNDGALRREIDVLLASVDGAADSLHDTVARGAALLQQAAVDSHVGTRIGPYRLYLCRGADRRETASSARK